MKKLLLILGLIGLVFVVGAWWLSETPASEVKFNTEPLVIGNLAEVVSTTGPLSPVEVTLVSSLVPGQVVAIYPNADFNHYVEEGEPLLLLDQSLAHARLQQAESAVLSAKADFARATAARDAAQAGLDLQQQLADKKIGQIAQFEEAKYKYNAAKAAVLAAREMIGRAEAALREARIGFDKTVVRAPSAGVIIDREVYVGQMVGPQLPTPIFKIASDLSRMQVNAQVVEGDVSKVRVGMHAEFTVYAYTDDDTKFEGKVKQIRYMPTSLQGAVFYPTIIEVANRQVADGQRYAGGLFSTSSLGPLHSLAWFRMPPERNWMLRPGMTATVEIVRSRHLNVWKVPTEAFNFQPDKEYITSEAQARLDKMNEELSPRSDWKPVWIEDARKKPWPLFVRIGGANSMGEPGIKDGHFNEVLAWEPGFTPSVKNPPRVITSAPQKNKSFWEQNLRIAN